MDGTKLAAGSDDGFITIRDTSTGQLLKELREPWTGNAYPRVYSVRFSPDGNTVLTGALQLALWDVTSGTRLRKLDYALDRGSTIGNVFATFSPSGKSIATGASDAGITIVDTTTFKLFGALRGHSKWVHCVAFSADGKTLASASDDGKIKVWDLASGDEVRSLSGESEFMMSVAFSADGKMLASAGGSGDGNEGRVKIWEAGSGKELQTLNQKSRVDAVSFTPDGASVITGSYDGTLRVWSTANWSVVRKMPEGGLIR
jgi:WD40 repeat protein